MNKFVKNIINEIRLQIFNEEESGDKTIIALYPGRFQPMGRHHKASYDWLAKKFGEENTYVITSDKTEPQRSPFNFAEKKRIINRHGIKNVVKASRPYFPTEFLETLDPEKTVLVYMIGEKDKGRLDGYKRLMAYNKTTAIPFKDITNPYLYYIYAPHISIQIPSFGEMSGTNIRKALGDRSAKLEELKTRFTDIMGWFDAGVFNMVIRKMNENRGNIKEDVNDWFRAFANMSEEQGVVFFDILKKEYSDTKEVLPIIQKYIKRQPISNREKVLFRNQMKDTLKLAGLGAIAAIPIPGTMLLIPPIIQLAKKFNINLLPEVKEESEALPIVKREFWDKVFEEVLKEDTVICEECGESMKQIQYRHLKYKHNMSLEEYVKKHPNSKLVSESAKNYGDKNPMNIPGVRDKQKKSLNTPEMKKFFADMSRNRPVLDETRIKCSINNSMNNPENRKKVSERLKETYQNNEKLMETRRKKFTEIRNSETYKKRMIELGYWRSDDDIPKYEKYVSTVRRLTESSYKNHFYEIPNAKQRNKENHLDHKISINFGFNYNIDPEIIAHYCNLEVIPRSLNESKSTKNSITPLELSELITFSNHKIDTRQLLMCGGAAGHMQHLFEDMKLKFGDFKEMFRLGLSGEISVKGSPTEKLDGQNLFVTFKDGKLYAARNKGDIKSGGMDYTGIQTKFAGRGDVEKAFTYAFSDLELAISALTVKQQEKIFNKGKSWMNLEILYPQNANVINYDGAFIVFHGSATYDDNGIKTKDHPEYARILAGMIEQVNANTQETFSIEKPKKLTISQSADFSERLDYYLSQITSLQNKMSCDDQDTLGTWHHRWWKKFIVKKAKQMGADIKDSELNGLIKRWGFYDKSFALNSKNIKDEVFLDWAKNFDKSELALQLKKNMRPFESLVLKFGAEILKNVSDVMALNPKKTSEKLKSDVQLAIQTLSNSKDPNDLKVLHTQLKRIKAAGGLEKIAPLEGIVFNFNGKVYKLTGVFAPINQLLGYFKYK